MLTALFDGNCIVCQSTRRTITALDWRHRVNFVDFHDCDAWQSQYPKLNIKNMMGEIHVIDEDDNVYAGINATRRMLRELPLGWPLWLLLHLPGMETLGAALYRFVARRRYRINRLFGKPLPGCDHGGCKYPG